MFYVYYRTFTEFPNPWRRIAAPNGFNLYSKAFQAALELNRDLPVHIQIAICYIHESGSTDPLNYEIVKRN